MAEVTIPELRKREQEDAVWHLAEALQMARDGMRAAAAGEDGEWPDLNGWAVLFHTMAELEMTVTTITGGNLRVIEALAEEVGHRDGRYFGPNWTQAWK